MRGSPFRRALRRRASGVHLPVWPGTNGELYVGPGAPGDEPAPGRTLRRAVLEPLLRRIAANGGHVYADRPDPFDLLVELPGDAAEPANAARAFRLLDAALRDYAAILTRRTAAGVAAGAVTVTITGALSPRHLLAAQPDRYAFADGTFDDLGCWSAPADLVPMVSEHWSWRFGWDGLDPISPEERHMLHGLVREAHAEGRRVRFFGIPRRPRRACAAFRAELVRAGVDVLEAPGNAVVNTK